MKKIFISLAAASLFAACSKSSNDLVNGTTSANHALIGAYTGHYTRSDNPQVGEFRMYLNITMRYDGSSDQPGYPGICAGQYSLTPSTITFDDTCYAGGGYVLEGTYSYEKTGDSLSLFRTANGVSENYLMTKVYR